MQAVQHMQKKVAEEVHTLGESLLKCKSLDGYILQATPGAL